MRHGTGKQGSECTFEKVDSDPCFHGGEWRWKLYAANNKVIADSAEGYKNKSDCKAGARLVAGVAKNAGFWNKDDDKWED